MPFDYDVMIVGAGPGGIFSAWELSRLAPSMRIAVFELGRPLDQRRCPIDGKKIKSCVKGVMRCAYIWAISDRRFQRLFLQSISADLRCSQRQQRKARPILWMAAGMHTAVC